MVPCFSPLFCNSWYSTLKIMLISNYWMRLSRIWRLLQIKEGVIQGDQRPRWITLSEICRILHILREANSIIALLFIQNISPFLKEFRHFALFFSAHQNNTTLSPGFLGQRFNNLQRATTLIETEKYFEWIIKQITRLIDEYERIDFDMFWVDIYHYYSFKIFLRF